MRNIFDQYQQQENRLTHALAVCLDEDRKLLRAFLTWIAARAPDGQRRIFVVEQRLPGARPASEEDAEHRGLPDIVIHDGDAWCVLIESKVQARLHPDQLSRHERTLRRRGFRKTKRLVLSKAALKAHGAIARTWSDLYQWLGQSGSRFWPRQLRSYLRAAEVRLAGEGYLTEGTLTMFDGFQFTDDEPSPGEAKRLLKLAMEALKTRADLKRLGMDPKAEGRPALAGAWDFLALRDRPKKALFTRWPHLTLAMQSSHLEVAVTIPNDVARQVRRRLADLGSDGLSELNERIIRLARPIIVRGGHVEAYAVQRHYRTQRSHADIDARLTFKLETSKGGGRVKRQPEWLDLFATLLRSKRSNVQFGYVVRLPWTMKGMATRGALDLIADGWSALGPVLNVARG